MTALPSETEAAAKLGIKLQPWQQCILDLAASARQFTLYAPRVDRLNRSAIEAAWIAGQNLQGRDVVVVSPAGRVLHRADGTTEPLPDARLSAPATPYLCSLCDPKGDA